MTTSDEAAEESGKVRHLATVPTASERRMNCT